MNIMNIYVEFGDPIGNYCEAISYSFGSGMRAAGGPAVSAQRNDLHFLKKLDSSSVSRDITLAWRNGTTIPIVTIEVWETFRGLMLTYTLKNCSIDSLRRESGNTESVGLDCESIAYRYFA